MKKEENNQKEEKQRMLVVPGETIVSGKDYLPGDGTRREGEEIVANIFGLAEISGRLVKMIALAGTYFPRQGNVIIGVVSDINFKGWNLDIDSPYSSFLPMTECPRFIKGDLRDYYDIGDLMCCEVISFGNGSVDLSIKGSGLGKLENGISIKINSHKVPRVIGREGSMIKLIKEKTGCKIVVGQNGIVWILGDKVEDEILAKKAIEFVVNKSVIEGLTEKVEEWFKNQAKEKK